MDFDAEDWGYTEPNKSSLKVSRFLSSLMNSTSDTRIQRKNEQFFHTLIKAVTDGKGIIGTCAQALEEVGRPEQKVVRSALMATTLRLGDPDRGPESAIEISVKTSKATALQRPAIMKKFALRNLDAEDDDEMEVDDAADQAAVFAQLKMRTEYFVDRNPPAEDEDGDVKMEPEDGKSLLEGEEKKEKDMERVDKEELIKGFKYGTTYAPCPDGQFLKLETTKGITICGFFPLKDVCTVYFTSDCTH